MADTTFIYALTEPDTGEVRYVGKANDPKVRYKEHTKIYSPSFMRSEKELWVYELYTKGLKPGLVIIEECAISEWQKREKYWIKYYARGGRYLVNGMHIKAPNDLNRLQEKYKDTGKWWR